MKHLKFILPAVTLLGLILLTGCKDETKVIEIKDLPEPPQAGVADFRTDPNIEAGSRKFLSILNSSGKPLESMTPEEARKVLSGAQASVNVDYSGIEETEKIITQDGLSVKLTIVRPKGEDHVFRIQWPLLFMYLGFLSPEDYLDKTYLQLK
jgi:acetyl esterase